MELLCFFDGPDGIEQTSILFFPGFRKNRGRLGVDQSFFHQTINMLFYGWSGHIHRRTNGSEAGVALVGLSVLTEHEVCIYRQFSCGQAQVEDGIGHGKVIADESPSAHYTDRQGSNV